jgi:hypothetical protein
MWRKNVKRCEVAAEDASACLINRRRRRRDAEGILACIRWLSEARATPPVTAPQTDHPEGMAAPSVRPNLNHTRWGECGASSKKRRNQVAGDLRRSSSEPFRRGAGGGPGKGRASLVLDPESLRSEHEHDLRRPPAIAFLCTTFNRARAVGSGKRSRCPRRRFGSTRKKAGHRTQY